MRHSRHYCWIVLLAGAALAPAAYADDRDAIYLRAATADLAVFHKLARGGVLHRDDAQAELDFASRFDAIDIDRDRVVTAQEMDRYIKQTYGVTSVSSARSAPSASTGSSGR